MDQAAPRLSWIRRVSVPTLIATNLASVGLALSALYWQRNVADLYSQLENTLRQSSIQLRGLQYDREQAQRDQQSLRQGYYDQKISCNNMGENDALCGTVRPLTRGEKRLLRDFFGPEFPADDVRVGYFNNTLDRGFVYGAVVPNVIHINTNKTPGVLYDVNDLLNIDGDNPELAGTLFHEAAHIMHNRGLLPISGNARSDQHRYEYKVRDGDTFGSFTNEQGGAIVGDFVQIMFTYRKYGAFDRACEKNYARMSPEWVVSCKGHFQDMAPAARLVMRQFPGAARMATPFMRSIAAYKPVPARVTAMARPAPASR